MFGKNNRRSQSLDTQKNYVLKKLSIGLTSVAVGSFIALGHSVDVMAEEVDTAVELDTVVQEADATLVDTVEVETIADEVIDDTIVDDTAVEDAVTEEAAEVTEDAATEEAAEVIEIPKSETTIPAGEYGSEALDHIKHLSEEIGQRVAGTEKEREAASYIANEFERMGLDVEIQEFEFTSEDDGEVGKSQNIIATTRTDAIKEVIIGAHYDSVPTPGSNGAADNGSGVGVLLELASRIEKQLPKEYQEFNFKFIAFGAEEVGLKGSEYYASQLEGDDLDYTMGMINLDTLIGGDYLYLHAGQVTGLWDGEWLRDFIFWVNEDQFNFPLLTNPGLNPDYPRGSTGTWSDHAAFQALGIPVAYFESTNWEIGDFDGYIQSERFGSIMHTDKDNLYFVENNFPGQIENNLSTVIELLEAVILDFGHPQFYAEKPGDYDFGINLPGIQDPELRARVAAGEFPWLLEEYSDLAETGQAKSDIVKVLAEAEVKAETEKESTETTGEVLPDTATSTWTLGLVGLSLLTGGATINRKRD